MGEFQLSSKSTKFIDDLKLYLFSSGKNEQEIKDITEELEVHLFEAEQDGKSIDQIIGASPKEYMTSISTQMVTDYKTWAKYVPLVILGGLSFTIFGDLLKGPLEYSLLKISGSILFCLLFLGGVFGAFRYIARNQVSKVKEIFMISLPIFLNMSLFVGLLIADSMVKTPIIHFGWIGSAIIGICFLCFIIYFSIWGKTAVLPVILIAFHLPTFLLSFTTLDQVTQVIAGMAIAYTLIGLYLFYSFKKAKKS
jgi:uncharacterized membrane-anchored protein